jgi:hypothetical protein
MQRIISLAPKGGEGMQHTEDEIGKMWVRGTPPTPLRFRNNERYK